MEQMNNPHQEILKNTLIEDDIRFHKISTLLIRITQILNMYLEYSAISIDNIATKNDKSKTSNDTSINPETFEIKCFLRACLIS